MSRTRRPPPAGPAMVAQWPRLTAADRWLLAGRAQFLHRRWWWLTGVPLVYSGGLSVGGELMLLASSRGLGAINVALWGNQASWFLGLRACFGRPHSVVGVCKGARPSRSGVVIVASGG